MVLPRVLRCARLDGSGCTAPADLFEDLGGGFVVTRNDAARALDCRFVILALSVITQQPFLGAQVHALQTLALMDAPLLVAIRQQVARVEPDRLAVQRRLLFA